MPFAVPLLKGDGDVGTAQVLIDTVRMWRQVRRSRPVPAFQSLRRLHAEHERLIDDMNVVFTGRCHSGFPPPPVAGTDYIMPILTLEDLIAEGREQRNCVVSLASRIRSGSTALYRVLAPERCTLSLVQSGGTWTIGQLEASCNRAPSRGTRDAIRCWLRQE